MITLKLFKVGDSIGTTFPKEIAQKLRLVEGDELFLTETPNGFQITSLEPKLEDVMKIYREGADLYRDALEELAK